MQRRTFMIGLASIFLATSLGSTAHAFGQPVMDDPILLATTGATGSDPPAAKHNRRSRPNHTHLGRMKKKRAKQRRWSTNRRRRR